MSNSEDVVIEVTVEGKDALDTLQKISSALEKAEKSSEKLDKSLGKMASAGQKLSGSSTAISEFVRGLSNLQLSAQRTARIEAFAKAINELGKGAAGLKSIASSMQALGKLPNSFAQATASATALSQSLPILNQAMADTSAVTGYANAMKQLAAAMQQAANASKGVPLKIPGGGSPSSPTSGSRNPVPTSGGPMFPSGDLTRFQQLLREMAAAAQLADGPLGGIASRLSVIAGVSGRGAASVMAFMLSLTALYKIMEHGTKALIEQENSMLRLEGVVQRSGERLGATSEYLYALASQLSINTLFSTSEAAEAVAILSTFRNSSKEVVAEALRLSADLALFTGSTLPASARMLGRALNDPIQSMQLLTEAGIGLEDSQKRVVIAFQSSGNLLEAQRALLGFIAGDIAGNAKKMAEGVEGSFHLFSKAFDAFTKNLAKNSGVFDAFSTAVSNMAENLAFISFDAADALGTASVNDYSLAISGLTSRIERYKKALADLKKTPATGLTLFSNELEQRQLERDIHLLESQRGNYQAVRDRMMKGLAEEGGPGNPPKGGPLFSQAQIDADLERARQLAGGVTEYERQLAEAARNRDETLKMLERPHVAAALGPKGTATARTAALDVYHTNVENAIKTHNGTIFGMERDAREREYSLWEESLSGASDYAKERHSILRSGSERELELREQYITDLDILDKTGRGNLDRLELAHGAAQRLNKIKTNEELLALDKKYMSERHNLEKNDLAYQQQMDQYKLVNATDLEVTLAGIKASQQQAELAAKQAHDIAMLAAEQKNSNAMLDEAERYERQLAAIKAYYRGEAIKATTEDSNTAMATMLAGYAEATSATSTILGSMGSLIQSQGEKNLETVKAFQAAAAIASAISGALGAASNAARFGAPVAWYVYAAYMAQAMAAVGAIYAVKPGQRSAGGAGGGGAVAPSSNTAQRSNRTLDVTGISENQILTGRMLIDILREAVGDDVKIRFR